MKMVRECMVAVALIVLSGCPSSPSVPAAPPGSETAIEEDRDEVRDWLKSRAGDQWYGVYALGSKIGHARIGARPAAADEPGRWVVGTEVEMLVRGAGRASKTMMSEMNFYQGEPPFALVGSEMIEDSAGNRRVRRLTPSTPTWKIITTQGEDAARSHDVAPSEETLADAVALMPSDLGGLQVGQESTVKVFDWLSESDTRVLVEVLALEEIQRAGVSVKTARLAVTYEAMKTTLESVVAQGGIVLKTSFGAGIGLRLEEESVARSGVEGLDVLGTAIPVASKLGDPRAVTRLELALTLPATASIPDAPNQRVSPRTDGRTSVVITSVAAGPAATEDTATALNADATMDSDHPSIQLLAKSFVERFAEPRARALAIGHWVHENLTKELATHIPSASGVLARRVGDCTEHTWLFVALSRAAEIPARPVYGLMYLGDSQPAFGYHAWAEVALDGHWHPLDPTWNETLVDATHLRLGAGVQDVAGMIGQLKIEVISSRASPQGTATKRGEL